MSAATAEPSLLDPQEPAPPIPVATMNIHDWGALPPCPGEGNSWVMEYKRGYNKDMTHACQDYLDPNVDFDAKGRAIPSTWVPEYPLPPDIN